MVAKDVRSMTPAEDVEQALAALAVELALEAGLQAQAIRQRGTLETALKADRSLVTAADLAADRLIASRLARECPADRVISEESAKHALAQPALTAPRTWVIDPIDGTYNFVHGLSEWCVAVALLAYGKPHVAAIYFPQLGDELFYNRGQQLRVIRDASRGTARDQPLERALPSSSELFYTFETFHRRFDLSQPYLPRATGCMVLNLLQVVRGRAAAAFTDAMLWDVAAPLAMAGADLVFAPLEGGQPLAAFTPEHLRQADSLSTWRLSEPHLFVAREQLGTVRAAIARRGPTATPALPSTTT
jgi:fructose-1,6-bisphosphatase/inositol monophosphatase family enzyme